MADECTCVSCGDCNGLGQIMVPTGAYPEEDLETCPTCDGTGIVEQCGYCDELDEAAEQEEWA
jgi:DnaJ-class molecular chaperone